MEQQKYFTIAVPIEQKKKFDRLCKSLELSKKDFVIESMNYFEKSGVNPKEHESQKMELEKMNKRLNQAISFLKHHQDNVVFPQIMELIRFSNFNKESLELLNISMTQFIEFYRNRNEKQEQILIELLKK